tara:strand:+ start:11214 stop:11471 length:258 start_codon:yes stop_codon:yes gene_type:complete
MARHEINVFAEAMELKLRRNDHKGGWEETDLDTLFIRLREEVDELQEAIERENPFEVLFEAADVANFAMMIAWNVGKELFNGRRT